MLPENEEIVENQGVADEKSKTIRSEIFETLRIVVISLAIVIPIRFFVAQPFIVRGESMEQTYHDGEYLVVDELSYQFTDPKRGEVIIMRYPNNPREFFIKRVIGLPGETVVISGGRVAIRTASGALESLNETYVDNQELTTPDMERTLGSGEYFMMGDNRSNSLDSRSWGPLPKVDIVGRAFIRMWPISKISVLLGN
ncbi:MAG: signal peptidase I [Patescibacteria group bacterium]